MEFHVPDGTAGVAALAIGNVILLVWYASYAWFRQAEHGKRLDKLETRVDDHGSRLDELMGEVKERLARIEALLEFRRNPPRNP